jgi:hypothetical protein
MFGGLAAIECDGSHRRQPAIATIAARSSLRRDPQSREEFGLMTSYDTVAPPGLRRKLLCT